MVHSGGYTLRYTRHVSVHDNDLASCSSIQAAAATVTVTTQNPPELSARSNRNTRETTFDNKSDLRILFSLPL